MSNIFQRLGGRFIIPATIPAPDNGAVFDIEGDGLLDTITRLHCIVITELNCDRVHEYDHEHIEAGLEHLGRLDYLVGHNAINFDLPALRRLRNWAPRPECCIVDTLIASRLILPHLAALDD